jgi:GTPase Era involved in 16S rRNA processing
MSTYLLIGRSGVGKSSFVNSFFGASLAPISHVDACTTDVEEYPPSGFTGLYSSIRLLDTPGLMEGDESKDDVYLRRIADSLRHITLDGVIFVSELGTRFRPVESDFLGKITRTLGPPIWNSAWLALTRAAEVPREIRDERTEVFVTEITACLINATGGPNSLRRFRGFRKVLLVDNVVEQWTEGTRPLATFFQ